MQGCRVGNMNCTDGPSELAPLAQSAGGRWCIYFRFGDIQPVSLSIGNDTMNKIIDHAGRFYSKDVWRRVSDRSLLNG